MPDFNEIVLLLIIIGIIAFSIFNFFESKRRKEEHKRREEEFNVHKAELSAIRDREISREVPPHLKEALADFLSSCKENGIGKWNEFSPLVCFGYRVGKNNGRPEKIRREIIYFTWYAEIPEIIPHSYAVQWGRPGTYKRFEKIHKHLQKLGRQRQFRKNYEVAVEQWLSDASWFYDEYRALARRYERYGFEK